MRFPAAATTLLVLCCTAAAAAGSDEPPPLASLDQAGLVALTRADGSIEWRGRCGTPHDLRSDDLLLDLIAADCTADATVPEAGYDPGGGLLIDVWVHVIEKSNGDGALPDAEIHEQIAVLNEDFRALLGTPGANGNDARIFFRLAGVTRTVNTSWYRDAGDYWTELAVDPHHFLNIYTNSAGGYLGYAWVPQTIAGNVGADWDRVVILWETFGRDNGYWTLYDEGRTTTHEVGHHLGLFHTFDGCDSGDCNASGDLLCDTPHHSSPDYACVVTASTCSGNPNTPIENYMNYTPDLCMDRFTVEQRRRMRCTLEFYRPDLGTPVLFYDGFENGTATWSIASG